jgi:hypothetical protein
MFGVRSKGLIDDGTEVDREVWQVIDKWKRRRKGKEGSRSCVTANKSLVSEPRVLRLFERKEFGK